MSDLIRMPTEPPILVRMPKAKISFWKELKRLLLNDTHIGQYIPLIAETQQAKNVRLVNDPCYSTLEGERKLFWQHILPKYEPFDPSRAWMNVWYAVIVFVVLYYYVELGLVLTYGQQVWQAELSSIPFVIFNYLAVVILCGDVYLMLNKGYYTEGILIMDRKRILTNFLKRHFLIDIPSIIILFLCIVTQNYGLNYAKIYLVLKLYTLNKIDQIYQRKLQTKRLRKTVYVITRLLLIVLLLAHVMGLIFYAMDYYFLTSGIFAPEYCWLYSSTAFVGIIDEPWPIQYLYSLYWGVNTMTTISYGDIAGYNPVEVVYMLFCFILAFVIYGYVLNNIVRVILWAKEVDDNFRNQLIIIDTFMRRKDINQQLQSKIREYLQFLYSEESQRDQQLESIMIKKLPNQLRESLIKDAYRMFYLVLLGAFSDFPPEFLNSLIFNIEEHKYANNEIIFESETESQETMSLYFLQKGKVFLLAVMPNNQEQLTTVEGTNKPFGWLEFFSGEKRPYKAVSNTASNIYSLKKSAVIQLLDRFPANREFYRLLIDRVTLKRQYHFISYSCELCKNSHRMLDCPEKFTQFRKELKFHYKPDIESSKLKLMRKNTMRHDGLIKARKRTFRQPQPNFMRDVPKLQFEQFIRQKIEKRMGILSEQLELRREKFQVDLYYDWGYYERQWNYSQVQSIINAQAKQPEKGAEAVDPLLMLLGQP